MTTGVQAAWYPDPTGRTMHRYWDGSGRTEHVSRDGVQGTDAITGDYAPPTVTAPQWAASAPPRKRSPWPWIVGSIALLLALGVGDCVVLIGVGVKEAVNKLNAEQRAHAITQAQFDSIPLDTTQADVIARLGKQPEDSQEYVSKGVVNADAISFSCIYYNQVGEIFRSRYQFCFDQGRLTSKNSY